jgi:hypothetical protein
MSATKRIKYNLQTLFVPLDRDLQCAVLSMRLNGARRADEQRLPSESGDLAAYPGSLGPAVLFAQVDARGCTPELKE